MFARLGKMLVVLALVTTLGAHWVLLQSVAWAGMFASFSETGTIKEALVKTFDGKHPCCLCKAIAAAKKSEKQSAVTLNIVKLEFPPAQKIVALIAPAKFDLVPPVNSFAHSSAEKPPTPPPRAA